MAMRYNDATKLYQETIKRISKDENNWMAFLKSACKNYRLPFTDMVLIYAQRPDAIAVLEMEDWNKRYGLWIRPGSKGIAVFDDEYQGAARLKYYFDISDTKTTQFYRPVPIWSMREEFEEEVINTLVDQFGPLDSDKSLAQAIISASNNVVEDNIGDYLKDLEYSKTDSFLDGLDEQNTLLIYQGVLANSVAYATLSRCGIRAEDYIDQDSLRQISQFNTPASINAIGVPTKDISQMVIGEIRKTVLMIEREENRNRTIEKKEATLYNKDEDKAIQTERSDTDENRIYAERRISDTQSDIETGRGSDNWQIRNDEEKVPQGTSSNIIHELSDNTDTESTLAGDRSDSQSEESIDERTNDETDGRERGIKSNQPDGMDSLDEQHRGNDTGNHLQGTDLQLNTTINEAGTSYKIPAFFTLDEYEELIKYDRFRKHKNRDIQTVFQFYDDMKHRIAYVKESFTQTFVETIYQNIRMGFYPEDENLKVWKGSYTNPEHVDYISWEDITYFIDDMMERNVYLSIPLKPIPTTEEQQLNLFDMKPLEPTQINKPKPAFSMPQYIIDAVLAEGTEYKDHKLNIAIFLSLDLPVEENADYLSNIYQKGSNGFIVNNRNVAYKWDTDGMQITWGKGVENAFEKQTLSWKDCAKGIRSLLDQGRYLPQEDLDRLKELEYHRVAETLMLMYRDIDHEICDHMTEIGDYLHMGFVDGPPKLSTQLESKEFYDRIIQALYDFNADYEQNPSLMRNNWRHYAPDRIIPLVEHLAIPYLTFHASAYEEPTYSYFITQDTIDSTLCSEHHTHQKYETYAFYRNHPERKERIKFLKEIWGQGGSSRYNSDSKGLEIKTGSYNKPYASTLLKWKDVADKIATLITNNKYLSEKELLGMQDYERHKITMDIERFFYHRPLNNIRPYRISEGYYNEDNALYEFIGDKNNLAHVLDLMHITLNNTDESAITKDNLQEYLSHVEAYYYGTYTLFNEKKEPWTTTPYEPVLDVRQSIATTLTEFMEEYDAYEFRDQYDEIEFDTAITDTRDILQDTAGLEDLILYLNETIYEGLDPAMLAKATVIREEISMLYAERKGSDLSEGCEARYSYRPFISQEQPRYNTGDFVFLELDTPIYGRIELIDEDTITLCLFPDDSDKRDDIEIGKEEFEKALVYDYRNGYLYDKSRPLFRNEEEEQELQVLSDEERNTLGYQNYVLIKHIAPLIIDGTANLMIFTNVNEDSTISVTIDDSLVTLQEESTEEFKEYQFAFDPFRETLNIRAITENGETDELELANDQEPNDYNIEQQMNEFANDYIKSISDRGFWLQSIDMQLDGKDTKVVYSFDGNVAEYNSDPLEFDTFMDIYGKDPINTLSALIPIQMEGKDHVLLAEKPNLAHENFLLFKKIAPLIITGDTDYMHFVADEHMMPLTIEVFEGRVSVAHTYENNGDLMSDPLMEFVIDQEKETMSARSFEQSLMGVYRDVEVINGEVIDVDLEEDLNKYASKWFQNILDKEYQLEEIRVYADNAPIEVIYGSDGNIASFDGTDDDLKWFRESFGDDPQNRISALWPDMEEDEPENIPTEKEVAEIISGDSTLIDPIGKRQPGISHISTHKLYPEVPSVDRHNFRISDFDLGTGGPKEKYKANIQAIKLLKQLDEEQRLASPSEQEILSHYVGWGALPDAFDENKENWRNEYQELKVLLNDTEYKAARESTLTAFYTPPLVIDAIYRKLMDMGLKEGNILEPSCGVGNFIGMQPDELDCNFYGVELDTISGRIAQQLYQKSTIAIQGFEQTEIPDNLFDAVIGNVPYGQIPVFNPRYNQQNFNIHDYFFAKALDKVKVGGVVIFLTSKFTMDKKNRSVRKYIAQRADLLGAIRLPDNTFTANAGTRVTTDILVLQKREKPLEFEPEWIDVMNDEHGIIMNSYFIDHPEMVLGTMVEETSQYGLSTACKPMEGADLKEQLAQAMNSIKAEIVIDSALYVDEEDKSIPADPTVRNFSFCIVDGNIYYRENSRMYPYTTSKTGENRIRGMVQIRDCMRKLIDYQTFDSPANIITEQQKELHDVYDSFTNKYGLLNGRANKLAFQDDSSYSLICSLEILNEDRSFKKKADIFYKRTIKAQQATISVKTASEALTVSMAEKGRIDFDFMTTISNINKEDLILALHNVIYPNPEKIDDTGEPQYETSDEYLSGNVREKLAYAKHAAQKDSRYAGNITALEQVQPEPIKAGDINVRLGTTWIPKEIYKEFMYQLLDTPTYYRSNIDIHYVTSTQEWNITRKSLDHSIKATKRYGTHRINAYKILENTLNLRDVKIFDKTTDDEGKEIRVLNKKETAIAQDKQDMIKSEFNNWIWRDPERREQLCEIYNEKYNSIRNRTYDGSNLSFVGMNPDITLRKHQVDAIARILYGGNTLLAHSVGAGKTFEMIAAGMESKRLGFSSKPLYVVPNNIIGDFASDFYRLYPSANVLVATADTLSKANRHKFFARIATGEWDGIIITHSQFIKMPVSTERQRAIIIRQTNEISNNIRMLKEEDGERFTIKQLEKLQQKLRVKLEKLNDSSKKDDILCFEQLGIDMLFVDEADLFKNLFLYSKMRNVSGISQTDSQRAADLFMKTQYLDELTNYRGVVFATGTAISNSVAELYTMQRYLQYNVLQKYGLEAFDSWASTFGETVTAMELSPEGSGFKMKTRFSKFFNLPELMTMFREVADIQTPEMLNLPVPKANFEIVSVPASEEQAEMIEGLAERAEKVRNREVTPYEDNMLKITSDGRKVALEQRLINGLLPENPDSKVNACINNVYKLWEESADIKGTQLVFCDLSTPTKDSKNIIEMVETEDGYIPEHDSEFTNVYDEIKKKLIDKGIPSNEVAFIHDAKTDIQRKDLFAKVRLGNIRVLLGSTSKMGAGTNVQDLIVALHDLDCPWRPRDLEQRRGRGIRQGNINDTVHVVRYVTEGTFDAYLYQTIEKKQQFISQILTGKTPQRTMEEIDEAVMEYAAIKAIACGDPKIMERCNLELEVNKLNVLKANYQNQIYELQDSILKTLPRKISIQEEVIKHIQNDINVRNQHPIPEGEEFVGMTLDGVLYTDKTEAGNMLIQLCKKNTTSEYMKIGEFRGFQLNVSFSSLNMEYILTIENNWKYHITMGTDKLGNLTRINNALNGMEKMLDENKQQLSALQTQLETSKIEVSRPFEREDELQEKTKRLAKLTIELKLDEKEPGIIDEDEVDTSVDIEVRSKIRDYAR